MTLKQKLELIRKFRRIRSAKIKEIDVEKPDRETKIVTINKGENYSRHFIRIYKFGSFDTANIEIAGFSQQLGDIQFVKEIASDFI